MSLSDDSRFERALRQGNADFPVVAVPSIRGSVRRSDPDGLHAQAYFDALGGTSLDLEVGGFGGAPVSITVNFTTDSYTDAVSAVNAASPSHIVWVESGGYACIQSLHQGQYSYLKIVGGGAALAFKTSVYPQPGGYSLAGDLIAAPPGGRTQANPQSTALLAHNEDLSSSSINRAILGMTYGADRKLLDMDREIVQYEVFTATTSATGTVLRIDDATAADKRINVPALLASLTQTEDLSQAIAILTNATPPKAYYGTGGVLAKALYVSYSNPGGASPVNGTVPWGAPTGTAYDITRTGIWASPKMGPVAFSLVNGSLESIGASFLANKVQPKDQVLISGATNLSPFSHNGLFVVVDVPDEDHLVLRPLGPNETPAIAGAAQPAALNYELAGGEVYGNVTPLVGMSVTVLGPTAATDDCLFIKHNLTLSPGTVVKVRLPVSTTLREALDSFLVNQSFDEDDKIAYINKANIFQLLNTFSIGLVATGNTNATAVLGTGNGTGAGVTGIGGATDGNGVVGIASGNGSGVSGAGSATGGTGVSGQGGPDSPGGAFSGDGAGSGVEGYGGVDDAPGVLGQGGGVLGDGVIGAGGSGAAVGVRGFGGGTNGTGVLGSGGGANGTGVHGTGVGTGSGVVGSGGGTNGVGVLGTGVGTGPGVLGQGTNSGIGVSGIGGSAGGVGVQALGVGAASGLVSTGGATNGKGADVAGVGSGAGIRATGGATGPAIDANGFYETTERAAPAAPDAAKFRLFCRSNGIVGAGHRTQLIVKWPNGVESVITESDAT